MGYEMQKLHDAVNQGIIQCRGVYAAWAKAHGISYHRLLVLCTVRECGGCTQKQICDRYLLPRQTMHNTINGMRAEGLLAESQEYSQGREKGFVLTGKGSAYAAPLLRDLGEMEERAGRRMGAEKIRRMTELVQEYDRELAAAMEEQKKHEHDTD